MPCAFKITLIKHASLNGLVSKIGRKDFLQHGNFESKSFNDSSSAGYLDMSVKLLCQEYQAWFISVVYLLFCTAIR